MKCDNLWTLDGGAASFLFPSPRRAASSRIVSCERRRFPAGSDLKRSISNLHTEWVDHEMPCLARSYFRFTLLGIPSCRNAALCRPIEIGRAHVCTPVTDVAR